ncbi:MAG: DUF488 domain-containing protein [Candidatus Promineifilaceae bacterium]
MQIESLEPTPQQSIYTIGYGGRTVEAFLELLRRYNIAYLIDVRSKPYSRYQPDFTKQPLEDYLNAQDIRYVFMGDRLGGRPDDPNCYIDGKVDYERVRVQEFYLAGLERLEKAWRDGLGVVLLCSERKPEQCHRSKLIGRSLTDQGIEVIHIDENDDIVSQEEIMMRVIGPQPSLFGPDFHKLTSRKRYETKAVTGEEDTATAEMGDDA